MNLIKKSMIFLVLLSISVAAQAQVIRYEATGNPDVSGHMKIDVSGVVSGACTPNTIIKDLYLRVSVAGETHRFGLSDVITSDNTVMEKVKGAWIIQNGCGDLADNGETVIYFTHDGSIPSNDGDADLVIYDAGDLDESYPVRWVVRTPPIPTSNSWALLLLALSLGAVALVTLRKN